VVPIYPINIIQRGNVNRLGSDYYCYGPIIVEIIRGIGLFIFFFVLGVRLLFLKKMNAFISIRIYIRGIHSKM